MNNPLHVRLDQQNKELHLSKIMEWFGEDFIKRYPRHKGSSPAELTLVDYLILYLSDADSAFLLQHPDISISHIEYDWSLNAQPQP